MEEKWLGEKINTSGGYWETKLKGLHKRLESFKHDLYVYESDLTGQFYISDSGAIAKIESLLSEDNLKEKTEELKDFIHLVFIAKFGISELIGNYDRAIDNSYKDGYEEGRKSLQDELKKLLGF